MASVFQRNGHWTAKIKDQQGRWAMRTCGGADKATSQRLAQAWENEARDVREGRTDPRAKRFQKEGLRPLAEHVGDFQAMMTAKGNTPEHVAETTAHVKRVIDAMGASLATDLTADKVQKAIAGIRDSGRARAPAIPSSGASRPLPGGSNRTAGFATTMLATSRRSTMPPTSAG
jgi:hypothetical protein